jgi:hypothetical protein
MTMASCGGTGATEYAANRNRTWSGDGVMTAARSRVGPPAPAVPPRQDVGGHCRLAFASGAGRAGGMAVGPEAPPPNRTPLMEVASASKDSSKIIDQFPTRQEPSQSSSSISSASALVPTQMLTPVATHTHELDQPGRLEIIQIAAEVSGLMYEVPAVEPGARTAERARPLGVLCWRRCWRDGAARPYRPGPKRCPGRASDGGRGA